ncbi:MAG TPA: GFA family protein [Caulobacteraceae bacterium]|jgi:hypothetical protein|nr:GFA family protein [Caulobacteraceae bacterium]
MHVHGRCHCGAVEWEAEVDPEAASICNCTDCQTLSGAPFRASAPAKAESFRITKGQPRRYVKTADSGNARAQAFCGDCGAPLYSTQAENPQVYALRLGSLDQRGEITPKRHIWRDSALTWAQDVHGLPGIGGQT